MVNTSAAGMLSPGSVVANRAQVANGLSLSSNEIFNTFIDEQVALLLTRRRYSPGASPCPPPPHTHTHTHTPHARTYTYHTQLSL